MYKFEIFRGTQGAFRWRLKAANGEIVAQGEGHTIKQAALRTAQAVKAHAAVAMEEATE